MQGSLPFRKQGGAANPTCAQVCTSVPACHLLRGLQRCVACKAGL